MFTPSPFLFRASPEKLRDYSEHQAATWARRASIEIPCFAHTLTPHFPDCRPLPGRLLRSEQPHPRHAEQPDLEGPRARPASAPPAPSQEPVAHHSPLALVRSRRRSGRRRPRSRSPRSRASSSSGTRCTSTSACCSACHVPFCRLPALRACGRRDSGSPSPNPVRRRGRVADACVALPSICDGATPDAAFLTRPPLLRRDEPAPPAS